MTDQYLDQYKKETAQIHAPMDLIERTKAAVREEEERILSERTAQGKISATAVYHFRGCGDRAPERACAVRYLGKI